MHEPDWYRKNGIDLRLGRKVEALEAAELTLGVGESQHRYGAILIATGEVPVIPRFAGKPSPAVAPLWTIEHVRTIRKRISHCKKLIVIGGGLIGVEVALTAAGFRLDVTLLERSQRLVREELDGGASEVVANHVSAAGVVLMLGRSAENIERSNDGRVVVKLSDGTPLQGCMAILAIGARHDLAESAGLSTRTGILVDDMLATNAENIFSPKKATRCAARRWMQPRRGR